MKIVAALVAVLAATSAAADVCAPLDDVLAHLADRWGETPRLVGAGGAGTWMITGAADGSTFSVVMVQSDGTACLVGDGLAWELVPPAPEGEEG